MNRRADQEPQSYLELKSSRKRTTLISINCIYGCLDHRLLIELAPKKLFAFISVIWGNLVIAVSSLQNRWPGNQSYSSSKSKDIPLHDSTHPASKAIGTEGSLLAESGHGMKLTSHLHLVPKLKTCETALLSPTHPYNGTKLRIWTFYFH
jgi:hypothetical protein